jgi:AAA domain
VNIVADKDKPGHEHAAQVLGLVTHIAASVSTVEAKTGKDAADHIAAGHTLDDFVDIDLSPPAASEDVCDTPRVWKATDLKPATQPRWLAKGRIQCAATNLLCGDEGIGKSLLWVWVVAAVTTGNAIPKFGIPEREPAQVLLVVTEDDWCSTVRPRLETAGADLGQVSVIPTGSARPTPEIFTGPPTRCARRRMYPSSRSAMRRVGCWWVRTR